MRLLRVFLASAALLGSATSIALADSSAVGQGEFRVGHNLWRLTHTGIAGERRPLDVHVWYPADPRKWSSAPATVYRSPLDGVPLLPGTYDAISYRMPSLHAREEAPIDQGQRRFPVLIFSHGAGSPAVVNFAALGELVASYGFVVTAPVHLGDSFEDLRIDFVNAAAQRTVAPCLDGLPPPCFDDSTMTIQRNRIRDVSFLLDQLQAHADTVFSGRLDASRVGLLGFSRGGSIGLQLVAGNLKLGTAPEPRIRALMTLGTVAPLTDELLAKISVPMLLVSGTHDTTTPPEISERVFRAATGTSRILVSLHGARHRTFSSSYCELVQAMGAVASANGKAMERAMLADALKDTTGAEGTRAAGRTDSVLDFCPYESFVRPVDIRPIVGELSGYQITEKNVPRLADSHEARRLVGALTVSFFEAALNGGDPFRVPRFLTPEELLKKHKALVSVAKVAMAKGPERSSRPRR